MVRDAIGLDQGVWWRIFILHVKVAINNIFYGIMDLRFPNSFIPNKGVYFTLWLLNRPLFY